VGRGGGRVFDRWAVVEMEEREGERTPWWLWPNLLSLDAPAVAVAWLLLFAKTMRGHLPGMIPVFLAGTVWLIYVADRLLDARRLKAGGLLTARHAFYQENGRVMWVLWWIVFVSLAVMAPYYLPSGLLVRGIFLLGFVALYFAFVTGSSSEPSVPFLKEILCGLIFAMGTTVAVGFYVGMGSNGELLSVAGLIREWVLHVMDMSALGMPLFAFAFICAMNCALIEVWEGEGAGSAPDWSDRMRVTLGIFAAGALIWGVWGGGRFAVLYACLAVSAIGLAVLHHFKEKLTVDALRVLADVVLLTPLAGVWFVE
jgi:hypothetical protein